MVLPSLEVSAYLVTLALVGGYHLYLKWQLRHDETYTIQSVNNAARSAWVENIMSEEGNSILAVQTFRNSTMAATFLASTAILLIMGILNMMQNYDSAGSVLHGIHTGLLDNEDHEQIKLLILLATFFWAFFSFSMAVRMYNHVGYLINSTNTSQNFCPTPAYVSRLLNRSGTYYSYGMRAYYLSVPMVFGLFSPIYMMVASAGLIVALYIIDRAPDTQANSGDIRKRKLLRKQPGGKSAISKDHSDDDKVRFFTNRKWRSKA
jgi:uncharacterized membrane protein